MSIIGIFLIILGIGGAIVAFAATSMNEEKKSYNAFAFLGLGVILIGILFTSLATVPRGHVGVAILFGAVTGDYREPGLQFKSPLVKLKNVNVQTGLYETSAVAASRDMQDVTTEIAVNYHLSPAAAPAMLDTLGEDYIAKLAAPAVQETVKKITATYLAEELILKRPMVKADITNDLTERLAERGIIVETVSITNFQFSAVFASAIEAKVAAQQAVFEAENKLDRIMVEALQREAQALGEANAVVKEAEGQARAIAIVTAAQVQANRDIASSLNKEVLEYIFYDRLGDDIKVIITPRGTDMVMPDFSSYMMESEEVPEPMVFEPESIPEMEPVVPEDAVIIIP